MCVLNTTLPFRNDPDSSLIHINLWGHFRKGRVVFKTHTTCDRLDWVATLVKNRITKVDMSWPFHGTCQNKTCDWHRLLAHFVRIGEDWVLGWRPRSDDNVLPMRPNQCAMCIRYNKRYRSLLKKHTVQALRCANLQKRNQSLLNQIGELETQIKNRKDMISMTPLVVRCELS